MNQRLRTDHALNLHLINRDDCDGRTYPRLTPVQYTPPTLTRFTGALTATRPEGAIHYFIDDYQFERLWRDPARYIPLLQRFPATLTPDFSTYTDMPTPMQAWSIYRSRALGHYWQRHDITVIPTLQWSTPDTWDITLTDLPTGGTVAVSAIGCGTTPDAQALWHAGLHEAVRRTAPTHILHYDTPLPGTDWHGIPHTIYPNLHVERMQHGRQRRRQPQQ